MEMETETGTAVTFLGSPGKAVSESSPWACHALL